MRQIVIDTETTGLDPKAGHRVIEVGAVEVFDRRVTGETFHFYVNPEREVEEEALKVHNISNEFLLDKPLFKEIETQLFDFIQGAELIIHNAPFDLGFLDMEFSHHRPKFKTRDHCAVIDTLLLARKMHPGQRNTLDALCKRYAVDHSNREWHGALLDADLLARVYLAMTGGQASLFSETTEKKTAKEVAAIERKKREKLTIVKPSAEELQAHQAMLDRLEKSAGKHFWREKEV